MIKDLTQNIVGFTMNMYFTNKLILQLIDNWYHL